MPTLYKYLVLIFLAIHSKKTILSLLKKPYTSYRIKLKKPSRIIFSEPVTHV